MNGPDILQHFERHPDGSWVCVEAVSIQTAGGPVEIAPGMTFSYGTNVDGIDVAEMLERLGAQFGS